MMDFHENIMAVLRKKPVKTVPFGPYDNLVPRGTVERELRNRGMGLCHRHPLCWAERPNVRTERWTRGNVEYTVYKTPVGEVSTSVRTHLGRIVNGGIIYEERLIKKPEDYEPVVFMIDDSILHDSHNDFLNAVRDHGSDGIVRGNGIQTPYEASFDYFGLKRWALDRRVNLRSFRLLLAALERYNEKAWPIVLNSPAEFISMGELSGLYGPKEFQEYCLPFYKRYVPQLKERGKVCSIHAHALNLSAFKQIIAETGVDIIEAFTPPPVGNLSLVEARASWGPDIVIWLNFPETVFYQGPEKTKQYTLEMLETDAGNPMVIGFTEMGLYGIRDEITEQFFVKGINAIMDAIQEFSEKEF